MDIPAAVAHLLAGRDLTRDEARSVMEQIMTGAATPAQVGGFLVGMAMKGETPEELTGAVEVMRRLSLKVAVDAPHLVDTCGTGGSSSAKLFNVSTAAAFTAAAAGAHVAKHGNRAMSSKSGSADLLEAAGVNINLGPAEVARCVREVGVGFMFAPAHHGAMKHAVGPRRELGVRTLFNLLGPMTNPAGAPHQVLGVFDAKWQRPMAEVLKVLGSQHVLVVHADGLDELSLAGPSRIVELKDGAIEEYSISPEDVGLATRPLDSLRADGPEESLALVRTAFRGEGDAADLVALNAGAAIYAAGVCRTLRQGVDMAQDALASGLAGERLAELARISSLMAED